VSYALFMNLNGRPAEYFYPADGDTGVEGTIVSIQQGFTGTGIVRADGVQGVAGSGWAGAPTSGPLDTDPISYGNPLVLPFSGQGFSAGQRVRFDVVAAPYGAVAQNLQTI
jgi:hypothetical protein